MASILKVDEIQLSDGSTPTAADLGLDDAGTVLQVVYASNDTAISMATLTWTEGVSAVITPRSSTSKILVMAKASISGQNGAYESSVRLVRNGTPVGGNTDPSNLFAGDNIQASSGYQGGEGAMTYGFEYLDSPSSGSAITYSLQAIGGEAVSTYGLNKPYSASGSHYSNSGDSSLTLIEIAQ